MNFSEQLDQFVEREAVKYYYVETAAQEEKSMYRQISIIDYKAGQASLKPIVLKLYASLGDCVEAFQVIIPDFWESPLGKKLEKANEEIERMIGGEK